MPGRSARGSVSTPARPARVAAEVLAKHDEGAANRRLLLRIPDWPGALPGQFVMLSPGACTASDRTDPLLPRPMAVYRARGDEVEILYKLVGRGTALLAETLPGQWLHVVGPLGRAFPAPDAAGPALLVGGGTGIASLYQLAERAAATCEVRVLLGARSAGDLMGRTDFAALDVALRVTTEDGSDGTQGLVTEALVEDLAVHPGASVYACGPTPMMRRCAELAAERDARCFVSLENGMACGFGVCLGCAAPRSRGGYALVCRDGPIFDASEVAWEGLP